MTERAKLIEVMARVLDPLAWEICDKASDYAKLTPRQTHPLSLKKAAKILDALEAAGVRLVPVEATDEMVSAYYDEMPTFYHIDMRDTDEARQALARVLAASPYAPEGTGGE